MLLIVENPKPPTQTLTTRGENIMWLLAPTLQAMRMDSFPLQLKSMQVNPRQMKPDLLML